MENGTGHPGVVGEKAGKVRTVVADLQGFKGKFGLAPNGQRMILGRGEGQKVTGDCDSQEKGKGAMQNPSVPHATEHWDRRLVYYIHAKISV